MNTSFLPYLAAFVLFTPASFAGPHENLHTAGDALRRARATHNPEDLEEAKKRLQNAVKAEKTARRKAALKNVNDAIVVLKLGKRVEADKLMDEALSLIDEAVGKVSKKKK
jgi:hypothetical protein